MMSELSRVYNEKDRAPRVLRRFAYPSMFLACLCIQATTQRAGAQSLNQSELFSVDSSGLHASQRYTFSASGGHTSAYSDTATSGSYVRVVLTKRTSNRTTTQLAFVQYSRRDVSERFGAATDTSFNDRESQAWLSVFAKAGANVTINTTALFRTTSAGNSYMLRPEAVVNVFNPIAIVFAMRPTYDELQKRWSNAAEFGAYVTLPHRQTLSVSMLQTSRRYLQSPVTMLVDYKATTSSKFELRAGAAHGNGRDFRFTSGWGSITGMLTPTLGLTAEYKQRNGTFSRRAIGAGLLGRF